jgi:hypothetical protein
LALFHITAQHGVDAPLIAGTFGLEKADQVFVEANGDRLLFYGTTTSAALQSIASMSAQSGSLATAASMAASLGCVRDALRGAFLGGVADALLVDFTFLCPRHSGCR